MSFERFSSRLGFLVLVLSMLFITAFAFGHDFLPQKPIRDAQELYEEEQMQYPSVFRKFVSTVNRIRAPKHYNNPKVIDDPRFKGKSGTYIPKIYRPYPDYHSEKWQATHRDAFTPCMGPRGKSLKDSLDDEVGVYVGVPNNFPSPLFGSHEAIGWDGELSFDRYIRYGAYGFGEDDSLVQNWKKPSRVDWDEVNWGDLQRQCVDRNGGRYSQNSAVNFPFKTSDQHKDNIPPESRTAILIRTYIGKHYSDNDIYVIRSMVQEMNLQSGGEYSVFLLLHVKDDEIPIELEDVYRETVQANVPKEFWDMTVLWNVPMVSARYANLDRNIIDVHHAQWLSVQHFALEHPEYEYIWNWEIDSRFTGHHYEFLDKVAEFGRKQPRRGLWERNARFYIPGIHNDYEKSYRKYVQRSESEAIWGAAPIDARDPRVQPIGPAPPVSSPDQDNYEWGVGEEGDYIGFLPIFHPFGTDWVIRNEVFGYLGSDTPRRASLITHARLSRRLLMAMDSENIAGRHMGSELFPVSVALLHGFKAVTAPHPIYSDKNLPAKSVDRWFNTGVNGRAGSTKNSPFSWGRETRFREISWYYRANLPGLLYWPFLGWEKEGTGGTSYELLHGRVCLPSILFHPIKDVQPDADNTHFLFDSELGFIANPGP